MLLVVVVVRAAVIKVASIIHTCCKGCASPLVCSDVEIEIVRILRDLAEDGVFGGMLVLGWFTFWGGTAKPARPSVRSRLL